LAFDKGEELECPACGAGEKFRETVLKLIFLYLKYVALQSQLLTTNNRNNKAVYRLTQSCRRQKIYKMWNAM
jgi:hypothetical protein